MNKVLLAGFAWGCAAAMGSTPDANELMARSVKAAEANWSEAPHYSFLRTDAKSKRGSQPVKKAFEVLMIEGSPYLKVVAEDGHALTGSRVQEEEQKLQKETDRRGSESARERRRRLEKYNEDRNRDHMMLMELAKAFDYTVTEEPQAANHSVWLLEGKPKPGYVPPNREAKVLASMNVKFWIEKTAYQWLRVEAEVMEPVSIYGWIAKVGAGTKFILEQEPVSATLWLPKRFTMQINAYALGFINESSTQDEIYSNYRLNNATEAAERSEKAATGLQ
jgi:hypothetical protein